jgi:Zn-dependent peptidase ImmA (M78 family)
MVETEASGLSLRAIRDYAEKVGGEYEIYDANSRADLFVLLEELGGEVRVHDGPESLVVTDVGDFIVNIPTTTSSRRDRFTIAHELGHYFLHYLFPGRSGPAVFGRGLTNRAETEANTFASSLLMPEKGFREAYELVGPNARELAMIFEVSPRAAEVRCDVLRLER